MVKCRYQNIRNEKLKDIHFVGRINHEIFKVIADDFITDEVIITDIQIDHIKKRHPNDYVRFFQYVKEVVQNPDYILEVNKPDSAVLLKSITENGKNYKLILRFKTAVDPEEYKNSVITFLSIDDKDWNRLLKNKKVLYKHE